MLAKGVEEHQVSTYAGLAESAISFAFLLCMRLVHTLVRHRKRFKADCMYCSMCGRWGVCRTADFRSPPCLLAVLYRRCSVSPLTHGLFWSFARSRA